MEKSSIDTECTAMENLFLKIISNMKISFPLWEDLMGKAVKLNSALQTTITATSAFLEAFQKVANLAINSKGVGNEMSAALTKLCLRQRTVEDKLKTFTSAIMESLVNPLQDRMEEWKKTVVLLDKDHAKESKKAHQDIKKARSEIIRLKKKAKKGKPDVTKRLDNALDECNEKYRALEAVEKNALKSALTEERNRFCSFIHCLKPVVDCEVAMFSEMVNIEELIASLSSQAAQPFSFLPSYSLEHLTQDIKSAAETSPTKKISGAGSPRESRESRKSSVSSASSAFVVRSQPHTSSSNTLLLLNSSKRSIECRDSTTTAESLSKMPTMTVLAPPSVPVVRTTAPPQTLCTGWPEKTLVQTQTDDASGGSFREPACAGHQYAVPCSAPDADRCESAQSCWRNILNPYGKASLMKEREHVTTSVSPQQPNDAKRIPVVPLEGYVNMNQLACYAVQHQEINMKQEQTSNDDSPLPPPCVDLPPSGVTFPTLASGVYHVPTATNSIKRCTSNRATTIEGVSMIAQSLPRQHRPSTGVRRVNLVRDRSLPPISHKPPSKSNTFPFRTDNSPMARSPHGGRRPSLENQQLDYGREIKDLCSAFRFDAPLPPPPSPPSEMFQPIFTTYDDAVDDLPLPPPPDVVTTDDMCEFTMGRFVTAVNGQARHGSTVWSHARIVETMNDKFSDWKSQPPRCPSSNSYDRAVFGAKGRPLARRASEAAFAPAAASCADDLTVTIEKEVELRRTTTDDCLAQRL